EWYILDVYPTFVTEQEEPCESRGSRTVLWEHRGETPRCDPTVSHFKNSMQKTLLTILTAFIATLSFGQNAEELNKKSKEFLERQDFKTAVLLLRQAAEKGSSEAQYNYGICYQQGVEVPQSDSIANAWFLKAANQGWKDAQFKMAYSFATGRGVTQNDKQAFYWSIKCAEQRDVECMFNVVSCYMEGRGTQKNLDSMVAWATRLAMLDTPEDLQVSGQITSARANLATMYREGQTVPKDLSKSYMWYLIYNESKRDFSVLEQQKNIEAIQTLEKQISQADRDKAKLEAEKLLKKKLTNLANLYKQDL
uniref:tetratricopeptide repeat protein n=1 Tax=Flavisolibacter nicotianae TaxID=2364882 RepID=UPI001968C300